MRRVLRASVRLHQSRYPVARPRHNCRTRGSSERLRAGTRPGSPTRRVAAVKIGANVPGLMVEVRLTADQFDTGIDRRKELPWLTDNSIPAANPADLKTLWKLQNTSKCGTVARA